MGGLPKFHLHCKDQLKRFKDLLKDDLLIDDLFFGSRYFLMRKESVSTYVSPSVCKNPEPQANP